MAPPTTLQFDPTPLPSPPPRFPSFPSSSPQPLLHLSTLLQTNSLTLSSLSQTPFTHLHPSTLLSLRDLYYSTNPLPPPTPLHLATATHLLNLHPLAPYLQLISLSLLAPHAVLIAVCDWAARQTVHERRITACDALVALGSLTSYRVGKGAASSLLVSWLVDAFERCDEGGAAQLQRLCAFMRCLMRKRGDLGVRLLRGCEWLSGVVEALLDKGCLHQAIEVGRVVDEVEGEVVCESENIGAVMRKLGRLCGVEKRIQGEMGVVDGAMDCLGVFRRKFEGRGMMWGADVCWLVSWGCGEGDIDRIAEMVKRSNGELEKCELVVVLCALWRGEVGWVDEVLRKAGGKGWARDVWLAALVRQMGLLTTSEIERLFKRGIIVELVPGEGGRILRFAILGVQALKVLLSCQEITRQVCKDEMGMIRSVRGICVALVRAGEKDGEDAVILLRELMWLIAECFGEEAEYLKKYPVLAEVLTETSLELARKSRKGLENGLREGDGTATEKRNELAGMMQRLRERNGVCRKVCAVSLAVLRGVDHNDEQS